MRPVRRSRRCEYRSDRPWSTPCRRIPAPGPCPPPAGAGGPTRTGPPSNDLRGSLRTPPRHRIVSDEGVVDLFTDLVIGRPGCRSQPGAQPRRRRLHGRHGGLQHAVGQPRQPAWAAPTCCRLRRRTPPAGSRRSGSPAPMPGTEVTAASATGSAAPGTGGALNRSTVLLCTWRSQCGPTAAPTPAAAAGGCARRWRGYHHRPRAGCPG